MMEMVLDVDDIVDEMSAIRNEYCKYPKIKRDLSFEAEYLR